MTAGLGFDARKARQIAIRSLTTGATIVGGTIVVGGTPVEAAGFVVTNTNPSGAGSLAQAITDTNNAVGLDTITFANGVAGTISTASAPDIEDDLIIVGPGQAVITLTNAASEVLYLYNAAFGLSGVTLSNSGSDGLGGRQTGDVTVTDVSFHALGGSAIELRRSGVVTLTRVTVNDIGDAAVYLYDVGDVTMVGADFSGVGAGLDAIAAGAVSVSGSRISSRYDGVQVRDAGNVTVSDTTITGSDSGIDADRVGAVVVTDVEVTGSTRDGLTIYSAQDVNVIGSRFAVNGGIGIRVEYTNNVNFDDVTLDSNIRDGAQVRDVNDVTITNVDVRNNRRSGLRIDRTENVTITDAILVDNRGAGIDTAYLYDLTVTDVTVTGHGSSGIEIYGGRDATLTRVEVSDGSSDGIDVYNLDTLTLIDSTVSSNFGSGIAIRSTPEVTIERSDVLDNSGPGINLGESDVLTVAASTVSGSSDNGISADSVANVSIYQSTITDNAGAAVEAAAITTLNVNGSTLSGNLGPALSGFSYVPATYAAANGNIPTDDPMLEPLGDFGGPTLTRPPMTGSPAINAGDPLFVAPLTDQRGFARVTGGVLDIGSVEFDAGVAGMVAAAVSVAEDAGSVSIAVNRTGTGDGAASVLLTTAAGSASSGADFTGVSQTVSWGAGEIGAKTVNVPILPDQTFEGDEIFTVNLSNPVGLTLGAQTSTVVTVTNVVPTPAIVPVAPARYLDTRPGEKTFDMQSAGVGRASAGQVVTVKVAGRGAVPADAVGVVANLTAIAPGAPGFATMFPCGGTVPTASHVNYFAGEVVANNVVVPLNANGEVCIFTLAAADYAMDVNGYVPAGSPAGLFAPTRFLDTREGEQTFDDMSEGAGRATAGQIVEVQVAGRGAVPSSAAAVMVNVTSIFPDGPGFATLFPCGGTPPEASTLNYFAGTVVPNGAITKLSADGKVCIYTTSGADFALDVAGFVPAGVESLVTLSPVRVLETREGETTVDGLSQGIGRIGAGEFREVQIAGRGTVPADATAALLNVATVFPDGPGFVTLYPCGAVPTTSNLNHATGGTVRANNAITKLTADGKVCVFTLSGADIIIDLAGYLK